MSGSAVRLATSCWPPRHRPPQVKAKRRADFGMRNSSDAMTIGRANSRSRSTLSEQRERLGDSSPPCPVARHAAAHRRCGSAIQARHVLPAAMPSPTAGATRRLGFPRPAGHHAIAHRRCNSAIGLPTSCRPPRHRPPQVQLGDWASHVLPAATPPPTAGATRRLGFPRPAGRHATAHRRCNSAIGLPTSCRPPRHRPPQVQLGDWASHVLPAATPPPTAGATRRLGFPRPAGRHATAHRRCGKLRGDALQRWVDR